VKTKDLILVGIQLLLMGAFVLPIDINDALGVWPGRMQMHWTVAGGFIALGFILSLTAIWQLRAFMSPFPSPRSEAVLTTTGVFQYIRHPIYTGILIVFLAYSLAAASFYKLALTLVLGFFFHIKSAYEERLLSEKFSAYAEYQGRTGKFLPRLFPVNP